MEKQPSVEVQLKLDEALKELYKTQEQLEISQRRSALLLKKNKALKDDIEKSNIKSTVFEDELAVVNKRNQVLRAESSYFQRKFNDAEQRISTQDKRMAELQQTIVEKSNLLEESLHKFPEQFKSASSSTSSSLQLPSRESHDHHISILQKDLDEAKNLVESYESALRIKDSRILDLEMAIQDKQSRLSELATVRQERDTLAATVLTAQGEIQDLSVRIDAQRAINDHLQHKIEEEGQKHAELLEDVKTKAKKVFSAVITPPLLPNISSASTDSSLTNLTVSSDNSSSHTQAMSILSRFFDDQISEDEALKELSSLNVHLATSPVMPLAVEADLKADHKTVVTPSSNPLSPPPPFTPSLPLQATTMTPLKDAVDGEARDYRKERISTFSDLVSDESAQKNKTNENSLPSTPDATAPVLLLPSSSSSSISSSAVFSSVDTAFLNDASTTATVNNLTEYEVLPDSTRRALDLDSFVESLTSKDVDATAVDVVSTVDVEPSFPEKPVIRSKLRTPIIRDRALTLEEQDGSIIDSYSGSQDKSETGMIINDIDSKENNDGFDQKVVSISKKLNFVEDAPTSSLILPSSRSFSSSFSDSAPSTPAAHTAPSTLSPSTPSAPSPAILSVVEGFTPVKAAPSTSASNHGSTSGNGNDVNYNVPDVIIVEPHSEPLVPSTVYALGMSETTTANHDISSLPTTLSSSSISSSTSTSDSMTKSIAANTTTFISTATTAITTAATAAAAIATNPMTAPPVYAFKTEMILNDPEKLKRLILRARAIYTVLPSFAMDSDSSAPSITSSNNNVDANNDVSDRDRNNAKNNSDETNHVVADDDEVTQGNFHQDHNSSSKNTNENTKFSSMNTLQASVEESIQPEPNTILSEPKCEPESESITLSHANKDNLVVDEGSITTSAAANLAAHKEDATNGRADEKEGKERHKKDPFFVNTKDNFASSPFSADLLPATTTPSPTVPPTVLPSLTPPPPPPSGASCLPSTPSFSSGPMPSLSFPVTVYPQSTSVVVVPTILSTLTPHNSTSSAAEISAAMTSRLARASSSSDRTLPTKSSHSSSFTPFKFISKAYKALSFKDVKKSSSSSSSNSSGLGSPLSLHPSSSGSITAPPSTPSFTPPTPSSASTAPSSTLSRKSLGRKSLSRASYSQRMQDHGSNGVVVSGPSITSAPRNGNGGGIGGGASSAGSMHGGAGIDSVAEAAMSLARTSISAAAVSLSRNSMSSKAAAAVTGGGPEPKSSMGDSVMKGLKKEMESTTVYAKDRSGFMGFEGEGSESYNPSFGSIIRK